MFIIGIAGGTGSGKTSLAKALISNFDQKKINLIQQDSYYKDLSHIILEERATHNFDHPNAIDFKLMEKHLVDLSKGEKADIPEYDFSTHTRTNKTRLLVKPKIVILEGIFALYDPKIRNLINLKIFVETADDIRIMRRIKRDVIKRNRTLISVINQYHETVRPMHLEFVKNTKKHADIIVLDGSHNKIAIDLIKTKIKTKIKQKGND